MMEKKDNLTCSVLLALAGLAVICLADKIVRFFQSPNAIKDIIEFLRAAGMCVGLALLALAGLSLYALVSARQIDSKLSKLSRDYPVRCYPAEVKNSTPGPIPANLPEAPVQEPVYPVYLLLSITNYGISLAALPAQDTWAWFATDNASRFNQLSGDRPGQIVLPIGSFHLYYIFYHQEGNLTFELAPANKDGYTGSLSTPPDGYQVKIVIVYTAIMEVENLTQIISREQPLKLKLVALDEDGHDDPVATCELYNAVFEFMHPPDSEEDDSWMYRSRPTFWPWY